MIGRAPRFLAELQVPCGNKLGECPLWDDGRGLLCWIDIQGKRLLQHDPKGPAANYRHLEGLEDGWGGDELPFCIHVVSIFFCFLFGFLPLSKGSFGTYFRIKQKVLAKGTVGSQERKGWVR